MCSYHFSSVWFAEWPPFLKELLTRLTTLYSLEFDFFILVTLRFGFEGWIWVLITQVPGHSIFVTFSYCSMKYTNKETESTTINCKALSIDSR